MNYTVQGDLKHFELYTVNLKMQGQIKFQVLIIRFLIPIISGSPSACKQIQSNHLSFIVGLVISVCFSYFIFWFTWLFHSLLSVIFEQLSVYSFITELHTASDFPQTFFEAGNTLHVSSLKQPWKQQISHTEAKDVHLNPVDFIVETA